MTTHLLTGVAGFIGSHVAEALIARGDRVIGVDDFDAFYPRPLKESNLEGLRGSDRFRFVEADCASLEEMEAAVAGEEPAVIVHLAAKAGVRPSIEDPLAYVHANVVATQAMLELARRRGITRFVFGSSSSVYGNNESVPFSESDPVERPISPYAATKRANELMCHTYAHLFGISTICLRFFTVYGPRQRPDLAIRKFTKLMLEGRRVPMFGDGSTERDYTWVDDIVEGVVAAIDWSEGKGGAFEIVNLGESRTTSLARLIELIGEALGVEPQIEKLPLQPGDVQRTFADVSRARELLAYDPSTPVEVGIPRFVEWARAQHARGLL